MATVLSRSTISLTVLRCIVAAFIVFLITRTWADPDLWGHVLFGGDIIRTGALSVIDTYSFTAAKPWINHEWLAEVLMYLAYAAAGNFGLIALKTAVMLMALAAVLFALKPAALPPPVHDPLIFLVIAGTFGRAHVFRPQIFSIALFAALLLTLLAAERGRSWNLFAVPVIFAAWVNMHGGWIVGLGTFGVWVALRLLITERNGVSRARLLAISGASVLATLLNPYGWRMWAFLAETVRFERAEISDWQPVWQMPAIGLVPWIATAVFVMFVVFTTRGRFNLRLASIVVLCGVGSIFVNRLDMFFVLSAVMLLGPALRTRTTGMEVVRTPMRLELAALATVAVITLAVVASQPQFRCVIMDGTWQPEPEVTALVRERELRGRMLIYFDWGEYAIWHMAPAIQPSIDGRRETVYTESAIQEHLRVYRNEPDAAAIVAAMDPDFVWLPTSFAVLGDLEKRGWRPLFRGPMSTLLASSSAAASATPRTGRSVPRCFPGP